SVYGILDKRLWRRFLRFKAARGTKTDNRTAGSSTGNLMTRAHILLTRVQRPCPGRVYNRTRRFNFMPSPRLLTAALATLFLAGYAAAQTQDPAGQSTAPDQQPNINNPTPQQPAPPPADKNAKKEPGTGTPIASPDTVNPKNSKEDVDAVGNRNVG